jgi:hypothetical protein
MMRYAAILLTLVTATAAPALAQREVHPTPSRQPTPTTRPRANSGRLPTAPVRRPATARPEPEHITGGYTNSAPHVSHNHWYGHAAPTATRYRLAHPFPAGHFAHVGTAYRYPVVHIDQASHRFWFPGGFYFEVAAWEWPLVDGWCWDCGDDFVIYDDEDHPGWYLLYNVHTGTYVHVQYLGT